MDEILEILTQDARKTPQEIAALTGKTVDAVKKAIRQYEKDGAIVRYKTVLNPDIAKNPKAAVRALIEVSVAPEKNVGFEHVAERIYSFPEVSSCYLMSGTYDLLVIVEGDSIQAVASFISSKLSPMEHVRSTATHFLLKKYKEDGHVFVKKEKGKRLAISY